MQRRPCVIHLGQDHRRCLKAGYVLQAKQARAHAEQKRGEATSLEAEHQQAEARANELEQEARRARCYPPD